MSDPTILILPSCASCAFWRQTGGDGGYDYGECHQHPPTRGIDFIAPGGDGAPSDPVWARTWPTDYCGAYVSCQPHVDLTATATMIYARDQRRGPR